MNVIKRVGISEFRRNINKEYLIYIGSSLMGEIDLPPPEEKGG
ncbi:MAG: hypothetical protein RQ824_03170 [bacterium]|nr:hypothetical protein [bacterium]